MNFCPYCGNELRQTYKFCPKCGHDVSRFYKSNSISDKSKLHVTSITESPQTFSFKTAALGNSKDYFDIALKAASSYSLLKPRVSNIYRTFSSGDSLKNDFSEDDFIDLFSILLTYIRFIEELVKRYPDDDRLRELNEEIESQIQSFNSLYDIFLHTGDYPKQIPDFLLKNSGYIQNLIDFYSDDSSAEIKGVVDMLKDTAYCIDMISRGSYNHNSFRNNIKVKDLSNDNQVSVSKSEDTEQTDKKNREEHLIPYIASEYTQEINDLEKNIGEHGIPLKISYYNSDLDYWQELDKLIGLESVKKALKVSIDDYKLQLKRKEKHPDLELTTSLNSLFIGNPGTGKTTVARLVAGILCQEGLIKGGQCVEVDASNLISQYVGLSAQLTKLAALKSIDGILFIDEAYSIANSFNMSGGPGHGKDVIDTLTPLMENNRGRLNVILAGYEKEMSEFINDSNTGFPSRFKLNIKFEDYTPEEMFIIFKKLMRANKYIADEEAFYPLKMIFEYIYKQRERIPTFANARTVRSLFEKIKEKASQRMMQETESDIDRLIIQDMALSNQEIKEAIGIF